MEGKLASYTIRVYVNSNNLSKSQVGNRKIFLKALKLSYNLSKYIASRDYPNEILKSIIKKCTKMLIYF